MAKNRNKGSGSQGTPPAAKPAQSPQPPQEPPVEAVGAPIPDDAPVPQVDGLRPGAARCQASKTCLVGGVARMAGEKFSCLSETAARLVARGEAVILAEG